MSIVIYILIGSAAGLLGGLLGVGGGVIVIPALVYIFGLTQHQAQGTALAFMVPPITLLAAIRYYKAGNVNMGMAIFICFGFLIGSLIGADIAQAISDLWLKKMFGVLMLLFAIRMIFAK